MKCEALNKFLDILGGHLHDKEAKSEIDRIKKLLDSEPSLQSCVEALCRTLSVIFSLPPHFSETFMEHLFTASGEVLALDSSQNKEQVWNTVEDYLAGKDVDRVNQCLIRSWLLWQTCNFKDAYLSIVEAYKIAISFGQRNKESWAQDICISICSGWARELGCKGMLRKAEAMFQEVLSLSPGYLEAWCDLGHICLEQGKVKDALDAFQQAVKLVPEYWVAHKGIAQAYRHLGQLDKAERVLLEYIKPDRKNAALLGLLGLVQTDLGKSLSAIRSYKEALSLNPNAAESWNNLGGEFEQLGLHKEAIRAYRQAISLEPHSWPESQNLIRCLIKTNRLAKACGVLQGYLATQVQRVKEEPLWVPRDFSRVAADKILSDRNLVVGSDSKDRPPGSGRHVVDHYLTVVQEMLVAGLKEQELDPRKVVQDLVHIGIRWCSYAQWLSEKRLSKDFARERLYAIKQRLDELCQKEAKKHGFYTAWPEIEARIGATSRVEFAQEIIRRESKWLKSASQKQERGETEDFRWVFKGNLWVHLFEYEQNDKPEHLERVHYYIELLKGHTILRKLVDPRVMGSSIDVEKWNRYINALPVKVERTAVVDLETCTKILPENAVGLSFYFLRRALLPELLLVFVFKPGQAPSLRIARNGNDRLEKFRNAARRLKQVHDQVAWQPKVPAVRRIFCEITGEQRELNSREVVQATTKWEIKQLYRAYEAVLKDMVEEQEIRGKDLYVSPSPEMYDIPFGLLYNNNGFLNSIARSITIVPIFSLRRFQRKSIFTGGSGFVLCLEESWQDEAHDRAEAISERWCVGEAQCEINGNLSIVKDSSRMKYDDWIRAMQGKGITHVIGHHDASQWSRPTKSKSNLGQFGRYLYEVPEKLSADVLALEACWGGTWSEPEDLMGLFVSFLASGVNWVIASPYSLVPDATSRKLFNHVYGESIESADGQVGLQMARALRDAAEAIRQPAFLGDENVIPSLWGALQLYAIV